MARRKEPNSPNTTSKSIRCAIYTRKSTDEGLEKDFNSLDAQREAAEAYIASQIGEGWICLPDRYDDGGFTGGNLDRPALKKLIADIEAGKIDCVVVYKVDRLSRSLTDFGRLVEVFDKRGTSFVSVTQHFNTTNSMGRLTLNILLSFAQFEREIISERTRDKMAAARKKGKWAGGPPMLGYDVVNQKLEVNEPEAKQVREVFELYLDRRSLLTVAQELNDRGSTTKRWNTKAGTEKGGLRWTKDNVLALLRNVVYIGRVRHKAETYPGEHVGIVDQAVFDAVQALLSDNGRTNPNGPRGSDGAILCGLVRCRSCGCAMTPSCSVKKNRRYRYYVCVNAQKRGYRECPMPSVSAEVLETFVVDQIREIGRDPDLVAATFAEVQRQAEERLESLRNEADRLEAQIAGIYRQLAQAASQPDRLAALNAEVDDRQRVLAQIRLQIETTGRQNAHVGDVRRALAEFDGVWGALTRREQGELLRHVLEGVEFDGKSEEVTLAFRFGQLPAEDNQIVEEAA
ncbi:DNA-invertase hin [Caulifigura coniformis]|uniref:DNA-invertase hin n=1 Tax=Caulifigura coniformis TaxID=2527983 RepID=A0A517SII8_9PLAN|nr:recombinase family protein [Caulifigura coniformis]QDT55943.1 DNA-invertase hin [Caulifigura coniformis]